MLAILRSIIFWAGFATSFIVFIVVNVIDFIRQSARLCFDCDNGFGKPFRIYESGSMFHNREILWAGLIADLAIVTVTSILIGLVVYFITANLFKRSSFR